MDGAAMSRRKPCIARHRILVPIVAAIFMVACASEPEPREIEHVDVAKAPAKPAPQPAPRPVVLQPQYPETYVVKRGDTLWDISAMFLRDPWYWPEIWYVNPEIDNPHLIYPGDVLRLVWIDGVPRLVRDTDDATQRGDAVRVSPRVRYDTIEEAITTIPYEAIAAFLSNPSVIPVKEAKNLPYILESRGDHLVASAGNTIYVRGIDGEPGTRYKMVHIGEKLIDPDNGDVIGYEGIYVGESRVEHLGDPSTLIVTESAQEALDGDRLLPENPAIPMNFVPRPPESFVAGRIISVVDGVSVIGQYQIVVINRGALHGLEPGHVLEVLRAGAEVRDRFARGGFGTKVFGEKVKLPDEPAGTMMVFRTYDRISYALIMVALTEIHVMDIATSP